ncbi:MAG: hypothetical protein Q8Q24_00175, partial [bacterium]|nr:hypothetical protein [bacterium]
MSPERKKGPHEQNSVLIADRNLFRLTQLKRVLEQRGVRVIRAQETESALNSLENTNKKPSRVIVASLGLNWQEIAKTAKTKGLPITLIITAEKTDSNTAKR